MTVLIFDIGGVLLTNGWDHGQRKESCNFFDIDVEEYERKHEPLSHALDCGEISLRDYLKKTVFYTSRSFSEDQFLQHIREHSKPYNDMIDLARSFVGKYPLYTLNNESPELHEYRVKTFKLDQIFSVFFCSGFLGVAKPLPEIYRRVLGMLGIRPSEIIFIDDREGNLVVPKELGMRTIHHKVRNETEQKLKELLG